MATTAELHWLAGFLEGEGCFQFNTNACRVQAVQKTAWPLMHAQRIVGGKIYRIRNSINGRLYFALYLVGKRAAGAMMTLYPLLSPRRQLKISECLAKWRLVLNRGACNFKTHCKRGHPLNGDTTFRRADGTGRECTECSRRQKAEWYQRKKLLAVQKGDEHGC